MAESSDDVGLARDEAAFAAYSDALAVAVDGALEPWVRRVVIERAAAAGVDVAAAGDEIDAAAARCRAEVSPLVRALLSTDLDDQRSTPLALLRRAVVFPTEVLRGHGVPTVARDEFAIRAFPEDVYDLSPATFGDLGDDVHEPGLVWGAAKAHVHLARRASRAD